MRASKTLTVIIATISAASIKLIQNKFFTSRLVFYYQFHLNLRIQGSLIESELDFTTHSMNKMIKIKFQSSIKNTNLMD